MLSQISLIQNNHQLIEYSFDFELGESRTLIIKLIPQQIRVLASCNIFEFRYSSYHIAEISNNLPSFQYEQSFEQNFYKFFNKMRNYITLSNYLRQLITTSKQIKNIIYHPNFKLNIPSSYSLLSTCVNNYQAFIQYKQKVEKKQKTDIANQFLFCIMTGEFVNTGKIKGGGKLKKIIIKHSDLLDNIQKKQKINKGCVQIRIRKGFTYDVLNKYQKDSIIPNLINLKYQQYSQLLSNQPKLIKNKGLIIQSRSSCIPAFILFQGILNSLDKFKNFDIIDCCAAPGNKTLQLAQYLQSNGKVIAFQKDIKRYQTIKKRVEFYEAKNIQIHNEDFLKTNPSQYKSVKLILADPSCSGSGMLINFQRDNTNQISHNNFQQYCQQRIKNLSEEEYERIINLKKFQIEILKQCARFRPLRLVYSTCSIYKQENQQVVQEFLRENSQYQIKTIKANFDHGFGEIGKKCIRINPLNKMTDGFFVCLFKRKS